MLAHRLPTLPATPSAPAVFHIEQVSKVYVMGEVKVHALGSVDLDLYEGEFVVFLGPSGSGKSTLLNILGGLDVPSGGELYFRNQAMTHADERALTQFRRHSVGFVFQFYNLIPSLTARENVALVTDIARHPMKPEEALAMVGLEDRLEHFPAQLSGGEQQRVAIARAIAKRPEVLLCDEPTGALDFTTGKRVLETLERVNREFGTTTAVITHNAGIAAMADRVIHMRSGNIAEIYRNQTKLTPAELEW
ncbi:MAG: ABC transporter ATP-binding protein [Cyanobacteria bacterium J06597_16]